MPPEYLRSGIMSSKNDIFSLGVIIIKMMAGLTGMLRYCEMAPERFINLVRKLYVLFVTFVLHARPLYLS